MFPEENIQTTKTTATEKEEELDPPRNFTIKQLNYFDGTYDEKEKCDKAVYLSIKGIVFDVSKGRNFYGPDGPYEKFAGHECGVALAKMSFDIDYLDDIDGCHTLNFGEKTELEGWIDKFQHYRCYPIKGRLISNSTFDATRVITNSELATQAGTSNDIPEGYATAPIYVGAGEFVYDVSFGGVSFYGLGGPYHIFAGKDASRALGKMSLHDIDLQTADISDFDNKQHQTLQDWIKTFSERKGYPVVGRLEK